MHVLDKIPANIIFDFGGVLAKIDVHKAVALFSSMGMDKFDETNIHPYSSGIFYEVEKGNISPEKFLTGLRKFSEIGDTLTDEQLIDAWNSIILPYDYSRFEPVFKLRALGHKVFLLSNTNYIHHLYFESKFDQENPFGVKFKDMFDHVYYSDEMRMRKPDIEIYRKVLEEQNLVAEDTIFIDDNQCNLSAPLELGMQVYHFQKDDSVAALFSL